MTNFLKGLFGWNPETGRYSTTETLSIILIGLVVLATIYVFICGEFKYYTDLLFYSVGGASGNKFAKGIVTTVQSFKKEGGNENGEDSSN